MKKVINLILGVCVLLLAIICWRSIQDTIDFDAEVAYSANAFYRIYLRGIVAKVCPAHQFVVGTQGVYHLGNGRRYRNNPFWVVGNLYSTVVVVGVGVVAGSVGACGCIMLATYCSYGYHYNSQSKTD